MESGNYVIADKDTPWTVAKTFGVPLEEIAKENAIRIEKGKGQIFPFFNTARLDSILPNCTSLAFTYRVDQWGNPIYRTFDNHFYVFPAGIPDGQPIQVGSPWDLRKVFLYGGDWYIVANWQSGKSISIRSE